MKNISTGFGLCVAAAAALAFPFVSSLAPSANASAVSAAASAVRAAATSQTGPTIVWYQAFAIVGNAIASAGGYYEGTGFWVVRAWSDGRMEGRCVRTNNGSLQGCNGVVSPCVGPWVVISDPAQGYTYRSDINFDAKVDGADLGQLLADWGDAPRQDIPPSDCPLALINP
jgi:hypothetical protein